MHCTRSCARRGARAGATEESVSGLKKRSPIVADLASCRLSRLGSIVAVRPFAVALGASLAFFAAVPNAHAIIIRDDVDDAEYVVDQAQYPAVVRLIDSGDCLATLVHPTWVLTVAHCAADLETGATLDVAGESRTVNGITIHPRWQEGGDTYDIAMVRLDAAALHVEPYQIYRGSDEVDRPVEILGAGVTGTGEGGESRGVDDGMLRRATNTVDAVDAHFLRFTFNRPDSTAVTELEGVGAEGDSGGPVFLRMGGITYLAGMNAWGDHCDVGVGQYGAADYQTRVSAFAEWVDATIAGRSSEDGPSGGSSFADAECGCSVGGGGWLGLLVLVGGWRRRRR